MASQREAEPKKPARLKKAPAKELQRILDAGLPLLIHRTKIKNAVYNPRTISEKAKRKLTAGLRKHGLISFPTWNKRTGNLVGGHQRVAVLDAISGSDDYELNVVCVELTDAAEREANILLNNDEVVGDLDLGKLGAMLKDPTIDLVGTGFDMGSVYQMLGDSGIETRTADEIAGLAKQLRDARAAYTQTVSGTKKRDQVDFYMVVVFRDDEDRDAFCKKLGLTENRYQDGNQLMQLYGVKRA